MLVMSAAFSLPATLMVGCAHDTSPTTAPTASESMRPARSEEAVTNTGQELVGRRCRVRFRRDVLGVAGQAYISPTADTAVPNQPLYVEGVVQSVRRDAIVLEGANDQLIWIPIENVLMVETVK
jgi:hypothetical protein